MEALLIRKRCGKLIPFVRPNEGRRATTRVLGERSSVTGDARLDRHCAKALKAKRWPARASALQRNAAPDAEQCIAVPVVGIQLSSCARAPSLHDRHCIA